MAQQQEERLSGALQENVLTLLCFDDEHCKIIRGSVTPQLFESSVFKEVAGHACDFIDQYGEAVKEHLPDHLEGILRGDDERKAKTYQRLLDNLFASRESVNAVYVMSQLHRFVRMQRFKSSLIRAVEAVEDGRIDEAELEMQKGMKSQAVAFEAGLDMSKPDTIAQIYEHPEEEGFELGIPELDRRGIFPRRKQLYSLIAPRKRGKSWFLAHVGKRAMLARWKPLIITLELSELGYGARMLQTIFSISQREAKVRLPKLVRDRDGQLESVLVEEVERMTLRDPADRAALLQKAKRDLKKRRAPKIKEFPMHSLTMPELEAYLEGLERFENYTPDVIMVDYPRLMKHDAKNLRIELGQTLASLRGLATRRNCAMVVVHQGNRDSERAELVTADMAEEDISIVAASDVVLTYSQTKPEKKLGLARLYAEYIRNGEAGFQVLITQAYAVGQFCLDSAPLGMGYWDVVKDRAEHDEGRRRRPDDAEEKQ